MCLDPVSALLIDLLPKFLMNIEVSSESERCVNNGTSMLRRSKQKSRVSRNSHELNKSDEKIIGID